ncbi:MAG: hypothetical protein GWP10_08675 [Nitrospiraceae bacterium]|nr:hypothetical protein [Nitrospiraceae bacterium]
MFRPVKLTRLTIQVPEDQVSAVMAILGDLRLLQGRRDAPWSPGLCRSY